MWERSLCAFYNMSSGSNAVETASCDVGWGRGHLWGLPPNWGAPSWGPPSCCCVWGRLFRAACGEDPVIAIPQGWRVQQQLTQLQVQILALVCRASAYIYIYIYPKHIYIYITLNIYIYV